MKKIFFIVALTVIYITLSSATKSTPIKHRPVIEGNIYFSTTPFKSSNTNSKKNFTSAEYIYARLELPAGTTIKEAFKLKDNERNLPFVKCKLTVMKNGEVIPYGSSRDHVLLQQEDLKGNVLNFDILPEPSKAMTLYSMLDDFSAGYGFNPISGLIQNGQWPDGDYTVRVTIYSETSNAYGSLHDEDKWPAVSGEFEFKFKEDDAVKIMANSKTIRETSIENSFRYDNLPPVFAKPGPLTDPNATSAKILAILKRDLPQRQIIKWVAESYAGPYWHIATDDYGLPKYKYFNPHIWMAYKMNGKCYVGYATLRQVYSGGGTYGPLQVAFTSASSLPDKGIDCVKIK